MLPWKENQNVALRKAELVDNAEENRMFAVMVDLVVRSRGPQNVILWRIQRINAIF